MATKSWNNNDGNKLWSDPTNWTPSGLPSAEDAVQIGDGYTVQLSNFAPIDIASLAVGASTLTVVISPTDTVTGDVSIAANGLMAVDDTAGAGGSLAIGGALSVGGSFEVGTIIPALATVTAGALVLGATGAIDLGSVNTSGTGIQAELDLGSVAGFGTVGTLTGNVDIRRDARLEFASGEITAIASTGSLSLIGAQSLLTDSGSPDSNSALSELGSNAGTITLHNGASIATTGDLDNSGFLSLDEFYGTNGDGSSLSVGGTLTNSGNLDITASSQNDGIATQVTAAGLSNTATGVINLNAGAIGDQAVLDITSTAGFGTTGTLSGFADLTGNALVEFASGEISTIASSGGLILAGSQAVVADSGSTTSNSALTGLSSVAGALALYNGAAVAIAGDLDNGGSIWVDANAGSSANDAGGSSLSIVGTLTTGRLRDRQRSFIKLGQRRRAREYRWD